MKKYVSPSGSAWQTTSWSPQNFRFDELDRDSACIPYGKAQVVMSTAFWGRTLRVQGRLLGPDLPYKPRWRPPAQVLACERLWQGLMRAIRLDQWSRRLQKRIMSWPRIAAAPSLEVSIESRSIIRYTPTEDEFVIEGTFLPRPTGQQTFSIGFRLRDVAASGLLAQIATFLQAAPLPLALWQRMRDWQFRNLQHRRLRLIAVWVDDDLVIDFRHLAAAPGPALRKQARSGLNIVGHFLSEHSIGDAARASVQAADAAGIPTRLVRLRIPLTSSQNDTRMKTRLSETMTHPVSLYHINVRETEDIERYHGTNWTTGRYNIAYWAWDTREFPDDWVRFARRFDEIWSPSQFSADAIQRRVPIPVLTMPHVIEFPVPTDTDLRTKFGLPQNLFLYIFVFDLNSLAERKNPEAVVEAFRRVVAKNPATGLVLKTHNSARNSADIERLRDRIAGLPNVFLLDHTLPRFDVYRLMAACDAFVSLHHAEGFGLCVAEAMFLGKPVVSTNWSATSEYVNSQNGFPVRYRLVRLDHHVDDYARSTEWAEPDIEHAAACMEALAADPSLCAALGAQASRDIRDRFSATTIGQLYAQRLESILFW